MIQVKRIHVQTRVNAIINRLNKTKIEREPDLPAEKIARQREDRQELREIEKKKVRRAARRPGNLVLV